VLQIPMNLRQGEAERGAAHEAGHIVVALSLGVTLDKVSRVESAQLPDILQRRVSTRPLPPITPIRSMRSNLDANS
jgi:hypothetical protein